MTITKTQSGVFEITIDDTSAQKLLESVIRSINPISLEEFLRTDVSDFFAADIGARFDAEGDQKSGAWTELSEATVAMREQLGFEGEHPINERTGELKEFVQHGREFLGGLEWVEMQVPGSPPDPITAQKLEHAQRGATSNPIPQFGQTRPRPVLTVDAADLEKILGMLVVHIEGFLTTAGFSSALGEAVA